MFIYCITNIINNKKYIGKVEKIGKTVEDRFQEHIKISKSNKRFCLQNSMRKYGIDNFNIEVLCICNSVKSLNLMEIFFIEKYKTYRYKYGNNFGYNLTVGGDGNTNPIFSKETRQKLSLKSKGRKFTSEHKVNLSNSIKEFRSDKDNNDKILTPLREAMKKEDIKKKMSEKAKLQWQNKRDIMMKSLNKPEVKLKHRNSIKKSWQ